MKITEEMKKRYARQGILTVADFCEYAEVIEAEISFGAKEENSEYWDVEISILEIVHKWKNDGVPIPCNLLSYQWWLCV